MQEREPAFSRTISTYSILIACAIAIGAILRIAPIAMEDIAVPFRPGGLFLEFAHQILHNGFRMPLRIPFYSDGGIPFAYPPLPFYVLAGLLHVFPASEIVIANLLPPLTSLVSLPLFLQLTKEWKLDHTAQLGAMFAFATMPAAFIEQIESAGLAEAFGQIATILFVISLMRVYRSRSMGTCLLAGLSWAFCVVSSPGSAYASAPTFILFAAAWLWHSKEHKSLIRAFLSLLAIGVTAILLSSPYWWTVVRNHGISVFTASINAQNGGAVGWVRFAISRIIAFNVAGGAFGFWANVLVLTGVIWAFRHRRWALIIWFLILISIPSEGRWLVSLPASILAGLGVAQVLESLDKWAGRLTKSAALAALCVGLLFNPIWAIRGFVSMYDTETWSESIDAMGWIRENTPTDAKLVVLGDPYIREWAPHVARRTVLNVFQGLEWQPKKQAAVRKLNQALASCEEWSCVSSKVAAATGYDKVYVYVEVDQFPHLLTSPTDEIAAFRIMWQNEVVTVGYLHAPKQ